MCLPGRLSRWKASPAGALACAGGLSFIICWGAPCFPRRLAFIACRSRPRLGLPPRFCFRGDSDELFHAAVANRRRLAAKLGDGDRANARRLLMGGDVQRAGAVRWGAFRVVRQPNLRALVSLIREADVIRLVGPCFLPLLVAWFLRKPVAIEHHGYPPVCPNGLLSYDPTKTVCPEALAQCMRTALDHPEVIMRNADVARRRALDFFSQRRMVKEYFDSYCQLAPAVNRGKKAQHLA